MEVLLELAGDMLHGAVVLHMLMCGCMFNRMSVVCLFWWYSPRKKNQHVSEVWQQYARWQIV